MLAKVTPCAAPIGIILRSQKSSVMPPRTPPPSSLPLPREPPPRSLPLPPRVRTGGASAGLLSARDRGDGGDTIPSRTAVSSVPASGVSKLDRREGECKLSGRCSSCSRGSTCKMKAHTHEVVMRPSAERKSGNGKESDLRMWLLISTRAGPTNA